MDEIRKVDLNLKSRAMFAPQTVNEEQRSIELIWTTGASVLRSNYMDGDFNEELSMKDSDINLSRLNAGAPLLNSHSAQTLSDQIGVVERAWVEANVGKAIVRFSSRSEVDGIWQDVKSGIIRNVSVGYRVYEYKKVAEDERGMPTYRAVNWEPFEISIVPIAADPASQIRSAEPSSSEPVFNPAPVGQTTEKSEMNDQIVPSPENGVDLDAVRSEAVASERMRVNAIHQAVRAAKLDNAVAEKFIADGVAADAARSEVLTMLERAAPKISSHVETVRDERDTFRTGMTEALMHRVSPSNKLSDNGKRFGGLSLLEMARAAVEVQGIKTQGMSKLEIAGRALHGTSDFPFITADVANKTLRQGYDNAARTFQSWARQASAPDFKNINRVQLGDAPSLEKVAESGEFTRGTVAEGKETYRIFTYGKVVSVSRQLLINDDLSAFTRIPELFGRAAADLESDIVYAVITGSYVMSDAQQLFSAAHKNTGTAGAISIASLSEARKSMRKQKGLAGRYINVQPRYLVVGPDNETVAQQFLNNDFVPQQNSNINPFAGSTLQLVVDPRIENFNWFLAADPGQIDTVEYTYLEGQQGVAIETEMGFDVDGMSIKVRHDFGAAPIDYRGLFKNAYTGA